MRFLDRSATEGGVKTIRAGLLEVAYLKFGNPNGWPVILSHGFPFDVHAYDDVAPALAEQGARVIVPYLRGFGPTRLLLEHTPRSGQQAALAHDLLAFVDALEIEKAPLAATIGAAWRRASRLPSDRIV